MITKIPARSEAIIYVFVEREDQDGCDGDKEFLVEPLEKFIDKYPLIMAAAVVETSNSVTSSIRVMNPSGEEVVIHQDTEIGSAERLEAAPTLLLPTEDVWETKNINAVRRIQLSTSKLVK